mmetsp:Transcript_5698/g.11988  ORF Transcript_5698/g.11988 Transcript_5698/m.11988 type:complete len:155 (+) Transcript_5698:703-1167(+)
MTSSIRLFVRVMRGSSSSLSLEVRPTDTIGSVKAKIEHTENISCSEQKLVFATEVLCHDRSVRDYGITDGSTLQLMRGSVFRLFVRTLWGDTYTFQVEDDITTRELKSRICEKSGVDPYMIVFAGKTLENERALSSYLIAKNCTVFAVARTRGG